MKRKFNKPGNPYGMQKMQDGGMPAAAPQEQTQQPDMNAIMQQVAQMLQGGANPEQVLQSLVELGIPQDQAVQLIQMVMQKMQGGGGGGEEAAPINPEEQAMQEQAQAQVAMRMGGYYN